jgi:hypothetical protein
VRACEWSHLQQITQLFADGIVQVWNAADDSEEPLVHMQVESVDGKDVGLNKCHWMNSGLSVGVNPGPLFFQTFRRSIVRDGHGWLCAHLRLVNWRKFVLKIHSESALCI